MTIRSLALSLLLASAGCAGATANAPPSESPPAAAPSGEGAHAAAPAAAGPSIAVASKTEAAAQRAAPLSTVALKQLVAAPDRTLDDRKIDPTRHPAELLAFMGVGPGMTVADLGAGGGYTTELLARAVGPTGTVYGQNDPSLLQRFLEKPWSARLGREANKRVIRSDRPFDEPLPPDAKNLDLVVNYIFYHDTVWVGVDRDKMNAAVFNALRPGGSYVVVDASAKEGHGTADAKTLHRIEEAAVTKEVTRAGFALGGKSDLLSNSADKRDWSSSPREAGPRLGTEDRFVLKFTKP